LLLLQRPRFSTDHNAPVGLFTVAANSFLISITSRKQVAQICGKPIYVVTGVALIPLSSQSHAKAAIDQANDGIGTRAKGAALGAGSDSDTSDDEDDHVAHTERTSVEEDAHAIPPTAGVAGEPSTPGLHRPSSSIAEDVIGRKGQYGRFAERWFSKNGWSVEKRRNQGMSANEAGEEVRGASLSPTASTTNFASANGAVDDVKPQAPKQASNVAVQLLPKLLRTTKILLGSESFYFSYDHDITRRLGTSTKNSSDLPLSKVVDPLFFWNRKLSSFLVDAGQPAFVLPIMQGYIGQRAFTVKTAPSASTSTIIDADEDVKDIIELQDNAAKPQDGFQASPPTRDFLLTLISRRSTLRPGLRYLRRGVDEEGHVANSVETEQLLSDPSWSASSSIYSFTQIRGSIPLFFSQSPYAFKPVPVLQHSYATNHVAFKRHFSDVVGRYGNVQIAVLVDKHGGEVKIGEEFEKHTKDVNEERGINGTKLGFEWFDFHTVCRGMKFENVSLLMDLLGQVLDSHGNAVEKDGKIVQSQSGILRTNCMDCLDRTNVVQSACGQRALEHQLAAEGVTLDIQADLTTQWFNSLWADNGDAISKQYSSTAALKGDYTRTRKRDYRGAINDFGLTLSRYFNNIVNDYFSQAAIDFLLGNVTDEVFEEFEANMMSGDPAMSMGRVRQNAIDTSAKIVIEDHTEELVSGWTLMAPRGSNTVRSFPFEEVVLLLTDAAIYSVRYDWNVEKVSSFERVDLRSITSISKGAYITSTLAAAQMDETRNVGILVKYRPGKEDIARANTRSLNNIVTPTSEGFDKDGKAAEECDPEARPKSREQDMKVLAFKALPARTSVAKQAQDGSGGAAAAVNEQEFVSSLCQEIAGIAGLSAGSVKEEDVISLADAKKSTGYLEQLGHSLKKLVWA
jgi:hypothetical protein